MRPGALDLLRCPACGGVLELSASLEDGLGKVLEGELICSSCSASYRVREGIPDLLVPACLGAGNKLSKALYDLYAPLYDLLEDRLARLLGFTEEGLRQEIASFLDLDADRGQRVLEVCVGTGGNLPYIRARTEGLVVGLDISERMLRICQAKVRELGLGDIWLFRGCAEYLPFKDGFFHRVLIGGGISYFSDIRRALSEAARVAVDDGLIVVFEQVTVLERLLGKALLPLRYLPPGLRPLELKWLFGHRFYLLKLAREH